MIDRTISAVWKPNKGSRPSKINCGASGWLTAREISRLTGLTKNGVHQRLRRMREAGQFDVEYLLSPKDISSVDCGQKGFLTVKEIALGTGLTENGVHQRLRSMKKAGKFDADYLLSPKRTEPEVDFNADTTDLHSAYLEGVAAHPETSCPYEARSFPQSRLDRFRSPMALWASWWAGYNDCDRGLA